MVPKPPASITNFLSTPNRVAHSLDWRKAAGSVLNMRISNNQIEIALASHPSFREPIMKLPSIPLTRTVVNNKKVIDNEVAKELARTIRQHHVCGMVVDWPVKGGWCGEECGNTLNVLDQLASENIFHDSRPICLYDVNNFTSTIDEWGRTPVYARSSQTTEHSNTFSSKANVGRNGDAVFNVWNNFSAAYWPNLPLKEEKPIEKQYAYAPSSDGFIVDEVSKRQAVAANNF